MASQSEELRLLIIGRPRCGKTTLARKLSLDHDIRPLHLDTLLGTMGWSDLSDHVCKELHTPGAWIIEGCSAVRGLRKWLRQNPGKKPDFEIQWLDTPFTTVLPKQHAFGTACRAIWNECYEELKRRNALSCVRGSK